MGLNSIGMKYTITCTEQVLVMTYFFNIHNKLNALNQLINFLRQCFGNVRNKNKEFGEDSKSLRNPSSLYIFLSIIDFFLHQCLKFYKMETRLLGFSSVKRP